MIHSQKKFQNAPKADFFSLIVVVNGSLLPFYPPVSFLFENVVRFQAFLDLLVPRTLHVTLAIN